MRKKVAANGGTPTTCLDEFAKDSDVEVRISVAVGPNTSPDALRALSG